MMTNIHPPARLGDSENHLQLGIFGDLVLSNSIQVHLGFGIYQLVRDDSEYRHMGRLIA
jgi:hypothetical protein